jgi:small subunit ribosomal protein S35
MFEDVPLDTRHHVSKVKPKFPREWRMTEERRKLLEDTRQQALLLDQAKEEDGTLVNGVEKINLHFNPPEPELKIPEYATARLGRSLAMPPQPPRKYQPSARR